MKEEKINGEEKVDKYQASSDKKAKSFLVMNNKNYVKEFPVGRMNLRFDPFAVMELSEDVINHPDFQQQLSYFSIKEK